MFQKEIIENKYFKITILLLVLFVCTGAVWASNETAHPMKETDEHTSNIDEIENLINNSDDNGTIQLDEKEYNLESNKSIVINKSVTINGAENKSIINGNNNYLNLDVPENKKEIEEGEFIFISPDDGIKNTGKHIIFNNIIFKNIKIKTWHKMEFNNCYFINSTMTSEELDNRFNNCIFNNSIIELAVIKGGLKEIHPVYTEIINCQFLESEIKTKIVYSTYYIHFDGGDFFNTFDSMNIVNSYLNNSKLSLNNLKLNITKVIFNNTNIYGHSNSINIKNSEFLNQNIDFIICKTNISDSTFNNAIMNLEASFFSIGSLTNLKNSSLNNSKIKISPGFRSRKSQINITECNIDNSHLDTTDTIVRIKNSKLNKSEILLSFSSLKINDATISNNDTIENTIKTKLQDEQETVVNGTLTNKTVYYQIKTDYNVYNTYFVNESGKYKLNNEDISKNTLYNFTYIKQEVYYLNNILVFKLTDQNGNPIVGEKIYVEIENKYYPTIPSIKTDENGYARYKLDEIGNFNITAYYYSPGFNIDRISNSMNFFISIKPNIDDLKISAYNLKTITYNNPKSYLKLSVLSKNNINLANIKIAIKLTSKNKNKTYYIYTNDKGMNSFKIPRKLDAGNYKLEILVVNTNLTKTIDFKVNKAKTIVKAQKVTNKFKKSKYFKISVKNKITKKALSKVKIKISINNNENHKTYTIKTDKNGIAKINTKNLKIGKYKVIISSNDKNYKISAKSSIIIEK